MAKKPIPRELSPRKARICTECGTRKFGDLNWECPRHPNKTIDQSDNPYRGQRMRLLTDEERKERDG